MAAKATSRGTDLDALVAFANELADASGKVILPYFRAGTLVDNKEEGRNFDPVTAADREAERVIRERIEATYPDHGIIGEELGSKPGERFTWILDPIDGTRSFITGLPLWGTLIGLLDGETPVVGMMDQPYTQERFVGTAESSHLIHNGNTTRLRTSTKTDLGQAHLASTHPDMFKPGEEADGFARLQSVARMTRFGGDCYLYAMLAAGQIDLVVEAGMNTYDIAGLVCVIEGAGGVVTTWDGGPAHPGGRMVAAANPDLHQKALDVLKARC